MNNGLGVASRRAYVALLDKVRPAFDALGGGVDRHDQSRHWVGSLGAIHDAERMVALGVPWWTYRAIDVVDAWLLGRGGSARVLEYGSGASTAWLADRATSVDSIEHDAPFAEVTRSLIADRPNARLHVVEPVASTHPATPSGRAEYAGLDFTDYVKAGVELGGPFDVVVVDGRARTACFDAAQPLLSDEGIIVFDNSRRARYRSSIDASGLDERIFRGAAPSLPYPEQTSILTAPR